MKYFYGLTSFAMLREIVYAVCDVLGRGAGDKAAILMLETAAQETRCGTYKDPTPYGAGAGVFQCDLIAFQDVQQRCPVSAYRRVSDEFGIDLKKAKHEQLLYSPLLAAIVCRIHYLLCVEPIPQNEHGRAEYWKRFYNSSLGKGTPLEYLAHTAIIQQLQEDEASV
ncbi:MAG TPA: hypothetical protein VIZ65_01100 [Cellvibrionaceae bacterium]